MLDILFVGKILIFESSAAWLCHHLGPDNLHSILPSWHLPAQPSPAQSRHSVKLVNLTSPLTTFAKTMQQHVRLIKKLAQLIRFQSASLPNNYRDPPPPVNPWPGTGGGEARGRPPAPASLLRSGCLINGRTKQQNTLHNCNVSPSCSEFFCPTAVKMKRNI